MLTAVNTQAMKRQRSVGVVPREKRRPEMKEGARDKHGAPSAE